MRRTPSLYAPKAVNTVLTPPSQKRTVFRGALMFHSYDILYNAVVATINFAPTVVIPSCRTFLSGIQVTFFFDAFWFHESFSFRNFRCRVSPLQTRSFCFGLRTQNHSCPCAAPPNLLKAAGSPGYLVHRPESGWRGNSLQVARPPFRSDSPR